MILFTIGEMLYKENGGLTTDTSKTNFKLNNQFYKNVFKKVRKTLKIRYIFKSTKNNSLSGSITEISF